MADQLLLEGRRTQPFARVEWLNPAVLGAAAPTGQALARFCVAFEHACTERVLQVRRSCDGNAQARLFCAGRSYVFPSRHEGYGLTLLEALACGVPAVCLDHDGARAVMKPEFGRVVRLSELRKALEEMMAHPERRARAGAAAKAWATEQCFATTAATLAGWIQET